MNEHKQFEIMCALAVVDQVNDADLANLKLHIAGCATCQSRISDFAQISAQALPLSGEKYGNHRAPKGMTARFVSRARIAGVPLREAGQSLPSELLIGSLGWKGKLTAALLLIMSIAIGVSKFIHFRAQSRDTATVEELELPRERSIQTRVTLVRSAPTQTERLPVQRRTKRYQNQAVLKNRLFSNSAEVNPQFFRSEQSGPNLPLLMAFAQYRPKMITGDYIAADPRDSAAMFASFSLHSELRIANRSLLIDSLTTRSQLPTKVDWYQLWVRAGAASFRDSDDSSQYHPGVLRPGWPFSKESKVDQQ